MYDDDIIMEFYLINRVGNPSRIRCYDRNLKRQFLSYWKNKEKGTVACRETVACGLAINAELVSIFPPDRVTQFGPYKGTSSTFFRQVLKENLFLFIIMEQWRLHHDRKLAKLFDLLTNLKEEKSWNCVAFSSNLCVWWCKRNEYYTYSRSS